MNRDVKIVVEWMKHYLARWNEGLVPGHVAQAVERLSTPKPKRRRTAKPSRKEKIGAIREAVWLRSGGCCEAYRMADGGWVRCLQGGVVLDHWLGGIGRRTQMESVETCWLLCSICNFDRTHNRPSAAWWNANRAQHDHLYGYPHTPHIETLAVLASRKPEIIAI